jgi:lipopolysaccharide/colanic/teichoic acid biosynthesis glycosyltransferase
VQERVGQNGRVFRLYKLRTMVTGAEEGTGPVLAATDDARITPVGRWLRATRLDELPQVFNVLKGEMSFVGPRPERPEFVERFRAESPAYHYRHLVKPGLTGLAQVQGRYSTSAEDKLRFDLYYIRNYSLLLDLQILLQTIPIVITPAAARGQSGVPEPNTGAFLTNCPAQYRQQQLLDKRGQG